MIRRYAILAAFLLVIRTAAMGLTMDWAYHDDNDGTDDRATEFAPGTDKAFLGNQATSIPDGEPVVLYVLTVNQFAGDADEQVFARWWNGQEEKWIMGSWEANVFLGTGDDEAGRFHGLPNDESVMLDLWKIEIPADATLPGENFYVIQLKAWAEAGNEEGYLLRDTSEEGSNNNLGQSWTAGSFFGHDWSVQISE